MLREEVRIDEPFSDDEVWGSRVATISLSITIAGLVLTSLFINLFMV